MTRRPKPVGVLTKTFQVLQALNDSETPPTLKELSEATGLNTTTTYRLLAHLENEGWIRRSGRNTYALGSKLAGLGRTAGEHGNLRSLARPFLWGLWKFSAETTNLAVLDGTEVVYLDGLESPHDFRMVTNIGMRAIVHRTALGKAILAKLPAEERKPIVASLPYQAFTPHTLVTPEALEQALVQIAKVGYAVDDEESVLGVRCVGAAIPDTNGHPVAAFSVSGPAARITRERVPALGLALCEAAQEVSAVLHPDKDPGEERGRRPRRRATAAARG